MSARQRDMPRNNPVITQFSPDRTRVPAPPAASPAETHAALAGALQDRVGNEVVLSALSGAETPLDQLVGGTLTLATAGVSLGGDLDGLWSPSAVAGFVGETVARDAVEDEEVAPHAARAVAAALTGGAPLPPAVAARLSAAFGGADLSAVRVHTGPAAVTAAEAISARAFTVGNDVVFGREGLHPETPSGLALLAHELTHVLQHQEGRLGPAGGEGLEVSSPHDATELEAERSARAVVAAMPAVDTALAGDSLADVDPYAYLEYSGEQDAGAAVEASPGSAGLASRGKEDEDKAQKPVVEGKKLGVWKETTSADLIGGAEILPPSKEERGFSSYPEALAWGAAKVAGAHGGVVVKAGDRYYVFSMTVKTWFYAFSRANVEGGLDQVTAEGGEVAGIQCFLTNDGHVVPPTVSRSDSKSKPVYIVERGKAGGYWHPTQVPDASGYTDLAKQAKDGKLNDLSKEEAVALFKGMVKSKAIAQIQANRKKIAELEATYQPGSGKAEQDPHWTRLRELSEKDQLLAAKQKQLEDEKSKLNWSYALMQVGKGEAGGLMGPTEYEMDLLRQIQALSPQIEEVKKVRATLRRCYPELGTVDTAAVKPSTSNAEIFQGMQEKFKALRDELDRLHTSIHEDDTPISKLGPIVAQTKAELGVGEADADDTTKLGAHVNDWLASEDTTEKVISFGGALLGIALGIGAIIASGGWAVVLGLAGAGVGLGTAAYDLERADDLYTAAKAGVGSGQFVDDPEGAKFNYVMGWVNLVIAGLDVGLAVKAGTTVLKGSKAASAMMELAGSEVLAKLKPDQILDFKKAMSLRQAGKGAEAEALLKTLKGKLGEETFDAANRLFGKSALLDELFGASAKLTAEAKAGLSGLGDDLLRQIASKGDDFAQQTGALLRKVGKDMDPNTLAKLAMDVDPATLSKVAGEVGGKALKTLAEGLPPASFNALSPNQLTSLGRVAQKNPEKLALVLKDLSQTGDNKLIALIADVGENANVKGLAEFIDDAANKAAKNAGDLGSWTQAQRQDLRNMVNELHTVQSEAGKLKPGELVELGGDVKSAGKTYDVRVVDGATGQVKRSIEVKTIDVKVNTPKDLNPGVAHAVEKMPGLPPGSTCEASIVVELPTGTQPMGKGSKAPLRTMGADGRYSTQMPDGTTKAGDFFQDWIDQFLNKVKARPQGTENVNRITIYDKEGKLLRTLVQDKGVWRIE